MERETKDFITLALLFDFMSFTAFALRKHCSSEWTPDELNVLTYISHTCNLQQMTSRLDLLVQLSIAN